MKLNDLQDAVGKLRERDGMTKHQRQLLELNVARWLGELMLPCDIHLDGLAEMAEALGDHVQREVEITRDGRGVLQRELIAIAVARFFAHSSKNSRVVAGARSRTENLLDIPPGGIGKLERKYRRKSRAYGLESEIISRGEIAPERRIAKHVECIKSAAATTDIEIFIRMYYTD